MKGSAEEQGRVLSHDAELLQSLKDQIDVRADQGVETKDPWKIQIFELGESIEVHNNGMMSVIQEVEFKQKYDLMGWGLDFQRSDESTKIHQKNKAMETAKFLNYIAGEFVKTKNHDRDRTGEKSFQLSSSGSSIEYRDASKLPPGWIAIDIVNTF